MIGVSLAELNCSFSMVLGLGIPRNKLNFGRNCTLLDFDVFFRGCRHFADKKEPFLISRSGIIFLYFHIAFPQVGHLSTISGLGV